MSGIAEMKEDQMIRLTVSIVNGLISGNSLYEHLPDVTKNPVPLFTAATLEMATLCYGIADSIEKSGTNDPEALKAVRFIRSKIGETPALLANQGGPNH